MNDLHKNNYCKRKISKISDKGEGEREGVPLPFPPPFHHPLTLMMSGYCLNLFPQGATYTTSPRNPDLLNSLKNNSFFAWQHICIF